MHVSELPSSLNEYKPIISAIYEQLSTYIHYKAPDEFDLSGNLIPKPDTISTFIHNYNTYRETYTVNINQIRSDYNDIKDDYINAERAHSNYALSTYFYHNENNKSYDYIRKSDNTGSVKDLQYKKNIVFMAQYYRKRDTNLYNTVTTYINTTDISAFFTNYIYDENNEYDPMFYETLTSNVYPVSTGINADTYKRYGTGKYSGNFYNQNVLTSYIVSLPKHTYMISTTGQVYTPAQPTNIQLTYNEMVLDGVYNPLSTNAPTDNTLSGRMHSLMNNTNRKINDIFLTNLSSVYYRRAKKKLNNSTAFANFKTACVNYNTFLMNYYNDNWMPVSEYLNQKPQQQSYVLIPNEDTKWRKEILTAYIDYINNKYPPVLDGSLYKITKTGKYGRLHQIVDNDQLFYETFLSDE